MNLPNALTLSRLLLLPVLSALALSESGLMQFIAALLFGIAALTDWFDGYLARKLNQVTEFGAILDPLVDRIFIITSVIVLYLKISDLVPLWAVLIVVGRDLLMVTGWLFFKSRGLQIAVTREGKVATAVLMISLFVLLLNGGGMFEALTYLGVALFYIGVVLSVITGVKYAMAALLNAENKSEE